MQDVLKVAKVYNKPIRRKILQLIGQYPECTQTDLIIRLRQVGRQGHVAQHLIQLEAAALINVQKDGKYRRYTLTKNYAEMIDVLTNANDRLQHYANNTTTKRI